MLSSFLRRLTTGAVLLVACQTAAHAQASRTWVSGVGDDANPCSRTAPCKTFAGAISKTAANGVISVLDPGGFGTVTITKGITIDGGGMDGSIISASTTGVIVNAGAANSVRLRNITIDGGGTGLYGVRFLAGGTLYLDNVRIHGAGGSPGHGVHFAPSGSSRLDISDSIIGNNLGAGIYIQPGAAGFARVAISNTRLYNNSHGMKAEDRSTVSIRNSSSSNNNNTGILASSNGQAVEINVEDCQITNNGVANSSSGGIKSTGALASIVISGNVISGNYNGIKTESGGDVFSFGTNRVVSNTVDGMPTGTLTSR